MPTGVGFWGGREGPALNQAGLVFSLPPACSLAPVSSSLPAGRQSAYVEEPQVSVLCSYVLGAFRVCL